MENNDYEYNQGYDDEIQPLSASTERPRRSRRRKSGGCAGTIVYFITVLGVSLILSLIAIFVANDIFAFVTENDAKELTVPENTDVVSLADQLDKQGIVHYGSVFKLYVKLKGDNKSVLAGTYHLNPSMDYGQIIGALTNSITNETITITIPEGYSIAQVKKLLLDEHVCTEDAADEILNEYPFKHTFLEDEKPPKEGWLEGYLFPDTYEIYKGNSNVKASINKMLNNFENKYDEDIQAGAEELDRSMHDIVIIASLIEREAKIDEDRARIAGVIYNRLNNPDDFPYLQIDASVLYGLGRTGGSLSQADLDRDTPYNLYTRQDLPPGPICNPGYKSLYAATHPEDHYYYYYVAMPDGSHLFASSNEEHNNNIARAAAAAAEAASNTDNSNDGGDGNGE